MAQQILAEHPALTPSEIDWAALRRISSPKRISSGAARDFNREGVTVWRESHEPWRPVRFLFVLGFASGHYPAASADSPVFFSDDLTAVRDSLGLSLETPAERMRERRTRFKRQLGAVADFICFMSPRRDAAGASSSPSESLVFMTQRYTDVDDAESLILELDVAVERSRVRFLPFREAEPSRLPRTIVAEDIQIGFDLLALRTEISFFRCLG